jgi:CO/xanthine dehydrogenase Mo-binding subunit
MAEVAVDKSTGHVEVRRLATAIDAGLIVNPEGARQQIEGQLIMGLGYALSEEIRFKNGDILDRNFDSYEIPRFSWLPEMDVTLIDNPGIPSRGLGEPPIITQGAVLANAIYNAVGVRVTHMPMTPERIKAALKNQRGS